MQVSFKHPPRAGLLFNLTTGQVLWAHNPLVRMPIASLTKMMTALLAVQSGPPTARVRITKQAINMPGSKVGVLPLGKHVPLRASSTGCCCHRVTTPPSRSPSTSPAPSASSSCS